MRVWKIILTASNKSYSHGRLVWSRIEIEIIWFSYNKMWIWYVLNKFYWNFQIKAGFINIFIYIGCIEKERVYSWVWPDAKRVPPRVSLFHRFWFSLEKRISPSDSIRFHSWSVGVWPMAGLVVSDVSSPPSSNCGTKIKRKITLQDPLAYGIERRWWKIRFQQFEIRGFFSFWRVCFE